MEAFPTLLEIEANLAKLEPFYKAHADRQPDSPPLWTVWIIPSKNKAQHLRDKRES